MCSHIDAYYLEVGEAVKKASFRSQEKQIEGELYLEYLFIFNDFSIRCWKVKVKAKLRSQIV